jgi:poly(A) polymerase
MEQTSEDRALNALRWAADVATEGRALFDRPPQMPSEQQMRAVPLEQMREQVDRLLVGQHPEPALDALHRTGALEVWMPEVAKLVGFGDGEWRHKDVWKHTKQVVRQATPKLAVRWGALLHDIGKPKTRKFDEDGQVHFYGHSEVGAAMFRRKVAKRLGFTGWMYERVHFLILYHLRANQYDGTWTDSAVRRFYREMGEGLDDLLDLSRADITTKRPERRRRGVRQIEELSGRIEKLKQEDAKVPPLPKGLGNVLMQRFGIPPSKKLGDIRKQIEADVEQELIEPHHDADYYADWVEQNRERFDV